MQAHIYKLYRIDLFWLNLTICPVIFYQHHNWSNVISSLVAQCALLSVKTLYSCSDCHLFFSVPRNFSTKGQIQHVRKTKGMIFLSIIGLFALSVRLSLLKYFCFGNTCISSISHWMFGFQARSNSFAWNCLMQLSHSTKPNSQKKLGTYIQFLKSINWNISVITQSGTHIRKTRMEQVKCLNSKLLIIFFAYLMLSWNNKSRFSFEPWGDLKGTWPRPISSRIPCIP